MRHLGIEGYRIYCGGCHITTETMANRDSVVDRWNRRRTDGMIAWLDAEIRKCEKSDKDTLLGCRVALHQCKKQLLKLLDGMGVE